MSKIVYSVTATIPDAASAEEYVQWLVDGHVEGVLLGGAETGEVVRLDGDPIRVETRYVFPSREAFNAYEAGPAAELRADGKRRFPAERGFQFERRVGVSVGVGITTSPH
jgi:hypothetical protein